MPPPSDAAGVGQPLLETRARVLDDVALGWATRGVWLVCIAVYLTVFVGSMQAGGAELTALGRAVGFTLAAALLGRVALGFLGRAELPVNAVPMANQDGPSGSLVDAAPSTTVAQQNDQATPA